MGPVIKSSQNRPHEFVDIKKVLFNKRRGLKLKNVKQNQPTIVPAVNNNLAVAFKCLAGFSLNPRN